MALSEQVISVYLGNPSIGDIDRVVPLSFEFLKRHLARSEVFPNLTETYRTHESSLLFFFCFVHLNHNLMNFRCKDKNFPRNFQIKPQKLVKERLFFILTLFLFNCFYSIGRIIDSINAISSSLRPYLLYSISSVQG